MCIEGLPIVGGNMRRLVVTGRCKDEQAIYALLQQISGGSVLAIACTRLHGKRKFRLVLFPSVEITFTYRKGQWEFVVDGRGKGATLCIHARFSETTRTTYIFDWRAAFPEW